MLSSPFWGVCRTDQAQPPESQDLRVAPTRQTHLWLLLSHQFSNSLGLNFNLLEGKFGVKEFTVDLVGSQES